MSHTIPRVYVAGPYSTECVTTKHQNIQRAWRYSAMVAECGAMPYSPITNTSWLDKYGTVEWWYEATAEMLDVCDAILLMPGWTESNGACGEAIRAGMLDLVIIDAQAALDECMGIYIDDGDAMVRAFLHGLVYRFTGRAAA